MRTSAYYAVISFALCVAIPTIMVLNTSETVSVDEKRVLATWPEFSWEAYQNGSYGAAVDEYFDDHIPGRTSILRLTDRVKYYWGVHPYVPERTIYIKPKKESADAAQMQFLDDFNQSYSGNMLIIDGAVYTQNCGSPGMSPSFARMLNEYASKLKGHTRVFSCVAPLSSAFIPVEKYQSFRGRNKATLDAIRDNLNGPIFCDVLGELTAHQDEKLFYGTDHHWTARGAYHGYVAFCKSAGLSPVPLDQMERREKSGFLGSLYSLTRDASVREHPDLFEYFKPNVSATAVRFTESDLTHPIKSSVFCDGFNGPSCYMTFICGDAPLVKITTGIKNGRKAAVVKNSMGNAFSVYLVSHYEEIWVFDFRYSKHVMLDIIRTEKINDLIFALGMYGAMSSGTINMMRKLGEGGIGMPPKAPEHSLPTDSISTSLGNDSSLTKSTSIEGVRDTTTFKADSTKSSQRTP